ncbi:hypothetical protein [Mucilaginibacter sp. UYCu711]|uniref:hypothetical protein n=1 Tax=Mucilaginibacter sp. UYCu711 TaxID=3156339 RepID=UPI003D2463C6
MPTVHPNYIKASKIVLLQLVIALVNFFLYYNDMHARHKNYAPIAMIVVFGIVIYLLRIGINWVKYFFLVGFAFVNGKPANWAAMFTHGPLKIIWAITGMCISIWVLWLLFTIPNQQASNKKSPDYPGPGIV